jgi:hypothetical protein
MKSEFQLDSIFHFFIPNVLKHDFYLPNIFELSSINPSVIILPLLMLARSLYIPLLQTIIPFIVPPHG